MESTNANNPSQGQADTTSSHQSPNLNWFESLKKSISKNA